MVFYLLDSKANLALVNFVPYQMHPIGAAPFFFLAIKKFHIQPLQITKLLQPSVIQENTSYNYLQIFLEKSCDHVIDPNI